MPYASREKQKAHDDAVKVYKRERVYGLGKGGLHALLKEQNNICPICLRSFDDVEVTVDHNHTCCPGYRSCGACVRGLLCKRCNTLLGLARDDVVILGRALKYLEV